MELTILGSNSAIPSHDRHPSSQHLVVGTTHILIDCGEGTQVRLAEQKISPLKLDIILISHLHGDHVFGLAPLLSTMNLQGRLKPLLVFGPTNLEPMMLKTLDYTGSALNYDVRFEDIECHEIQDIWSSDDLLIQSFPLIHRGPTFGYKVTKKKGKRKLNGPKAEEHNLSFEGRKCLKNGQSYVDDNHKHYAVEDFTFPGDPAKSYAYCSDTLYTETLLPWIKGVDLLYHESTYLDDLKEKAKDRYHATAKEAGIIARKARVKKLLIGHFSSRYHDPTPLLEEAKAEFALTEIAEEGTIFEV